MLKLKSDVKLVIFEALIKNMMLFKVKLVLLS